MKRYLRQYSKILTAAKILTKVITAAKKLYYDRIINNSDNKMKSTWQIINEERGKTKKDIDIQALMLDKKITMNEKEMAEILNNYFLSIATRSRVNNNIDIGTNVDASIKYLRDTFSTPFTKMKWRYTTSQEIEKIIKSFKTKNSSGYDEITSRIIKASLPYITSPLTFICNAVLHYSAFPDILKYAVVKLYFKKGSRLEIENYRPIS
jgi:hypothetical protein